jgi:hypothetical protein
MKNLIFLGFVAAIFATTSCTSEGVNNEADVRQTNAITFNSGLSSSRALNSLTDLTKFFVYGAKDGQTVLFDNQTVDRSASGWTYTYASGNKPMWVAGSTYKFYAYSAENKDLGSKAAYSIEDGLTFTGVRVGDINNNFDLVYATPVEQIGKMTGNAAVPFKFKHILSQIHFVFKNATENDGNVPYDVTVTRVKLNGYELTGDFDGTEWNMDNYVTNYGTADVDQYFTVNNANSVTSSSFALGESQKTVPLHVIPQTPLQNGDVVTLKFTYTITNRNDSTDTISKSFYANMYPEWKMGYRYNYIVDISLSSLEYIEFTAESLEDWSDASSAQLIELTEIKLGDY